MKNTILTILFLGVSILGSDIHAQTKVIPGYMGKKQVISYSFSTSLRFSYPTSEIETTRESFLGGFMDFFGPIGIHSLGYEHVITRKGSLSFRLSRNNAYMDIEPRGGSSWRVTEPDDIDHLRFGVTTLGLAWRSYSTLFAPLRSYLQFGVNTLFFSTPEVEYFNQQNNSSITAQHSSTLFSVNLEAGKTKVYRDVIIVDFAIGTNIGSFEGFFSRDMRGYNDIGDIQERFEGSARHAALASTSLYIRMTIGGIF